VVFLEPPQGSPIKTSRLGSSQRQLIASIIALIDCPFAPSEAVERTAMTGEDWRGLEKTPQLRSRNKGLDRCHWPLASAHLFPDCRADTILIEREPDNTPQTPSSSSSASSQIPPRPKRLLMTISCSWCRYFRLLSDVGSTTTPVSAMSFATEPVNHWRIET
jgi:hypothetical protein